MKLAELIAQAQAAFDKHGDVDVWLFPSGHHGVEPVLSVSTESKPVIYNTEKRVFVIEG